MPLVSKMIRYPNELTAMGLLNNGNNGSQGTVTPSEQSIKDTIIDINDFFINEMEMIKVPTQGEIDVNNISDINIYTLSQQYNNMNIMQSVSYGYSIFAFTDELQNSKPLFLKLNYNMYNLANKGNYPVQKNKFAFGIRVQLLDSNSKELYAFDSLNAYCNNNYDYTDQQAYYMKSIIKESNGFNNGDSIYVNLIPQKYVQVHTSHRFPPTDYFSNYICFYIERNVNYIKVIQLSGSIQEGYNNFPTTQSTNIIYIPYNSNYTYSSNQGVFIPFTNKTIENLKNSLSYTYDIDPLTNILYKNDNIMCAYNESVVDNIVHLDGDETKKYCAYKPNGINGLRYVNSTNYALLFRVK